MTETRIGPYSGVPVGEGGFAVVYRVTDAQGDPAALKWVNAEADAAIVDSIAHEFELLSQLIHPQLPCVHDFGLHLDRPYIVTDWIEGPSLWERSISLTESDFVRTLREMARVLLFLHHRGWVHGDLKPDNFRWRRSAGAPDSDVLCLLDFGLARPVGDSTRPRGAGTVGYCAPEFLRQQPADGRADWYAVGVILYEWIFGVRPFAAEEPADEIAGHLEAAPNFDRTRQRPSPEWTVDLIARLLAKNPDERGADIFDLLQWASRFDPALDPRTILNADLASHRQSEDRRLDPHDREMIDTLVRDADGGSIHRWVVTSQGDCSDVWPVQAASFLQRDGWAVTTNRSEVVSIHASRNDDQVQRQFEIVWNPAAQELSADPTHDTPTDSRRLTLLPWDAARVGRYLQGVTGDAEFAAHWAAKVHARTGGVRRCVSSLVETLIRDRHLILMATGWSLDESHLMRWSESADARQCFHDIHGDLSESEECLCEWLAVGRGFGNRRILNSVWGPQGQSFEKVFERLQERGVIVADRTAGTGRNLDVRLRLAGFSEILRAQMAEDRRMECARRLAEAVEGQVDGPPLARARLLADCFADAAGGERAARYALEAAALEIATEERDAALAHIDAAEAAAATIAEPGVKAHWLGRARMVRGDFQKAVGQLDQARQTYRELLILGRRTQDRRLLAETLKDLSDLYRITRRFDKGVRAVRMARRLWEQIGDRAEVSRAVNNLGNMYWVAADRVKARQYYEEALAMQRELGMDAAAATTLSNLGAIHLTDYDYVRAEAHFREALAIHRRLNVTVEAAGTLNNLGATQFLQGRLDDAETLFAEASEINAQAGAESECVFNKRNLVEVALERGDLRTAVTLGEEVRQTAEALGETATAAELSALLAEAFLRAGDFRQAQRHLSLAEAACATVRNDDLKAHLTLVSAWRQYRLGFAAEAASMLESLRDSSGASISRHLYLDLLALWLRIAVDANDDELIERLWQEGQSLASAVGAPHKAALLAFARLPDDPGPKIDAAGLKSLKHFVDSSPRWHWTAAYDMWRARRSAVDRDWEAAEHAIEHAITQLRRDGNWETLWRALVIRGEQCHAQADYEPAMRALNEAARILDAIGRTIDDPEERRRYVEQPTALTMQQTRQRIGQLVAG